MTKEVLLALAAAGLLALGSVAPVYAEDPPPADEGATMEVPADPDSAESGDVAPDPGTDEGGDAAGMEGGEPPAEPPAEPQPE